MTDLLTLQCDALRCEIKPALGGSVAGLWWGDVQVLRSVAGASMHSVRESASFPLVPFSNRVGHGQLQWAGTGHPLVKNFAPEPHTIHGIGWERPWQVLESGPQMALLSLEHKADAAWPFDFDASQAFKLSATGLEMSLSLTNQSHAPAPVGLGWHPYFAKRPSMRVKMGSTGRWEMGDDKLPTHRIAHAGLDTDFAALTVDHCFDGWDGTVVLTDALMRTTIRSGLGYVVVFTNPERDNIAVEPVSHVNNALALAPQLGVSPESLGVRVLQPGETFSCDMTIDVERFA